MREIPFLLAVLCFSAFVSTVLAPSRVSILALPPPRSAADQSALPDFSLATRRGFPDQPRRDPIVQVDFSLAPSGFCTVRRLDTDMSNRFNNPLAPLLVIYLQSDARQISMDSV